MKLSTILHLCLNNSAELFNLFSRVPKYAWKTVFGVISGNNLDL